MPSYSIPFPQSPISGEGGYVTREWFIFLSAIFQTIGGPIVVPGGGFAPIDAAKLFEEYPVTSPEAMDALRQTDDLRNTLDRNQGPILKELINRIDELSNELAYSRQQIDQYRNRIELIEDRLA